MCGNYFLLRLIIDSNRIVLEKNNRVKMCTKKSDNQKSANWIFLRKKIIDQAKKTRMVKKNISYSRMLKSSYILIGIVKMYD